MKNLNNIGRILLALPFVIFGINHFVIYDVFIGMLSSFIPNSVYLIFLIGAIMIVSGIAIIVNKQVLLFCYILAGLLITFILTIHIPSIIKGGENVHLVWFALLKDTGLLGGLLMIITNEMELRNLKNNLK
jgi:putative oxidoreductase